jgi:hypothetical protein
MMKKEVSKYIGRRGDIYWRFYIGGRFCEG